MKRYAEDDWDDESFDDSAGEFYPEDEDDGPDTIACPACGASMYDDSPRCPACGEYPSREEFHVKKPTWILLTGILCLLIALTWLLI